MDTAALVLALTSLASGGGGGGTSNVNVLSDTLTAGDTTITFSDSVIKANSFISVASEAWYESVSQSAGSVVITFPAQSTDMLVQIMVAN